MHPDAHNACILIVDDDPSVLALVRDILEREGFFNVVDSEDPREALAFFPALQPDLVLLDLQMPGMDGFETLRRLGPLIEPDDYLPILVLTGDISAAARQRALGEGACDFVGKPFDPVELTLRIRNQLHTRHLYTQLREHNSRLEEHVRERTAELRDALARAEAASHAKSNFLAVMSHELRTPLTSVVNYSEMLAEGLLGEVSESQRDALSAVSTAAWHLNRVVDDILEYASTERPGVSYEREIDAAALARQAMRMMEPVAQSAGLRLRLHAPDEPLRLRTDPDHLRRILLNLLSNAVRFTPQGEVALMLSATPDTVRYAVTDTGIGIPGEHLERIWTPFWQVEDALTRTTGGTGLGLAIVDRLVGQLGGTREVRSVPGQGSTFEIELPRAAGAAN